VTKCVAGVRVAYVDGFKTVRMAGLAEESVDAEDEGSATTPAAIATEATGAIVASEKARTLCSRRVLSKLVLCTEKKKTRQV
jgi:hypothetical protein